MAFYVSWNGATDVAHYRSWIADERDAVFRLGGVWRKTGFETNMTIGSARPWAFAEALDGRGMSLGNNGVMQTYIPADAVSKTCGKWHCFLEVRAAAGLLILGGPPGEKTRNFRGDFDGPGTLALLEQMPALFGLGMCAWLAWTSWRGQGRNLKGDRRVAKGQEPVM